MEVTDDDIIHRKWMDDVVGLVTSELLGSAPVGSNGTV